MSPFSSLEDQKVKKVEFYIFVIALFYFKYKKC